MVEEQRACGKAHDAKDAVQSLREHTLDFAADKTRGGEVEVGECEHVALDTALLFFVEGHDHEHSDKGAGGGGEDARGGPLEFRRGF